MVVACWRTTELGLHGSENDRGACDQMVRADVPRPVLLINGRSPRRIQIEWAELTGAVRRVRITRLGLAEAVLRSYRRHGVKRRRKLRSSCASLHLPLICGGKSSHKVVVRRCVSNGCRHRGVSRASSQLRNCDVSSSVSAFVATIVPIPGRECKKRKRKCQGVKEKDSGRWGRGRG